MRTPNEHAPRTQNEIILDHLRHHGSISHVEAEAVYKIRRLASRIDELRQSGLNIVSEPRKDAAGQRYVKYVLKDGALATGRRLAA